MGGYLQGLQESEKQIDTFGRKVFQKIFGVVKQGDAWQTRYNNELYELITDPTALAKIIKK